MSHVDPRDGVVVDRTRNPNERFAVGQVIAIRDRTTRLRLLGQMTPGQRSALRTYADAGLARSEAAAVEYRELLADLLDPESWKQ